VTATDVTDVRATARDEEWDSMKAATAQILNLLPSDVSALMKVELREAEVNSKKVGTKMKEINQVGGSIFHYAC
jgi:predicted extracellular nuclease